MKRGTVTILMAFLVFGGRCTPEELELGAGDIVSADDVHPREGDELRVLSWNIHGSSQRSDSAHVARVAEEILTFSPDVVFLQEVHRSTPGSAGADQVEELVARTGLSACFSPAIDIGKGSYGTVVLVRGPIESLDVVSLPGSGEPRSLGRCRVELLGRTVDLYSVHLTAWGRLNRADRAKQIDKLLELVEPGELPVLGGDFNASRRSPDLVAINSSVRLKSVLEEPLITHPSTRQSFDHIFVDRAWEVLEAEVPKRGPSDHWPVFAKLRIQEEPVGGTRRD